MYAVESEEQVAAPAIADGSKRKKRRRTPARGGKSERDSEEDEEEEVEEDEEDEEEDPGEEKEEKEEKEEGQEEEAEGGEGRDDKGEPGQEDSSDDRGGTGEWVALAAGGEYFELYFSLCRVGVFAILSGQDEDGESYVLLGKVVKVNTATKRFDAKMYSCTSDTTMQKCLTSEWHVSRNASVEEQDNWSVISYFPRLNTGGKLPKAVKDTTTETMGW